MDTKRDIGNIIENKLNMAQKAPSDTLWARVDASLDRKRKRRRLLFLWLSLGVIGVTTALWLNWPNVETKTDNTPAVSIETHKKELTSEEILKVDLTSEDDKTSVAIEDNVLVKSSISDHVSPEASAEAQEESLKSQLTSEVKKKTTQKNNNSSQSNVKITSKNNINDEDGSNVFDSASVVNPTYYYYDSEKDVQLELTDKRMIDSILDLKESRDKEAKKRVSDSLSENNNN